MARHFLHAQPTTHRYLAGETAQGALLRVLKLQQLAFKEICLGDAPQTAGAAAAIQFNGGVAPVTFAAFRGGPASGGGGPASSTEPIEFTRAAKRSKVAALKVDAARQVAVLVRQGDLVAVAYTGVPGEADTGLARVHSAGEHLATRGAPSEEEEESSSSKSVSVVWMSQSGAPKSHDPARPFSDPRSKKGKESVERVLVRPHSFSLSLSDSPYLFQLPLSLSPSQFHSA